MLTPEPANPILSLMPRATAFQFDAAATLAQSLGSLLPSHREAWLTALIVAAVNGLSIIMGQERISLFLYSLADHHSTKDPHP